MKRIVVASHNPVKLAAALEGFRRMFPQQEFQVEGVSVPSGVSDQPLSDEETYLGAQNRVLNAQATCPDADYWIGLEGGVALRGDDMLAFAWVVVRDGSRTGQSRSASFMLPSEIVALVKAGLELGEADDRVFGRVNSKQQTGSVGILTHDVLTRAMLYEQAVILALIPFAHEVLKF